MPIIFNDSTNPFIDELVSLANEQGNDHTNEGLFVTEHDEDELVDDSPTEDDIEPQILDFSNFNTPAPFSVPQNTGLLSRAIVAVDAGVVNLGELATGGTVFAIRGSAVCYPPNNEQPFVCRYNTGALAIDNKNAPFVFHYLGHRLGKPDLFVKILTTPPFYKPKEAMGETSNQVQDRCRNFVERMIQEEAISILNAYEGGILLIDGALSGGTFDTPESYMRNMLAGCRTRKINVVAISKKTRITIGRIPIASLFNGQPDFIGYAKLSELIDEERKEFIAENPSGRVRSAVTIADDIFAVRFGFDPSSFTFRSDVHPLVGIPSEKILDLLYSSCQIYGPTFRSLGSDNFRLLSFRYTKFARTLANPVVIATEQ